MEALHQKDAYKIGHKNQYPVGTSQIYSNFTARGGQHSNVKDSKGIYFVGLQFFIKEYLIEEWNNTFFNQPKEKVVSAYKRRVDKILGTDFDISHIEALHDLGYLPIHIKALPEGAFIPYNVPMHTITNTLPAHPDFYWVTNMLESVLSCELYLPCNSATTYMAYRKASIKYARLTCDDESFVPYQNHDFSMRGMQGRHAAAISGFASLACGSVGTDTIAAIDIAEDYYNANVDEELVGCSVSASEHSVCCAGGETNELENLKRLIAEVYPTGNFSYVSDSYDFWKVVTEYLPQLKDIILNRDGKLIIRPDSGDPVAIICGLDITEFSIEDCPTFSKFEAWALDVIDDYVLDDTPHGECGVDSCSEIFKWNNNFYEVTVEFDWNRYDKKYYYRDDSRIVSTIKIELTPEQKGLIECLWGTFKGTINTKGYKELNPKIGAIYGDSITLERQSQILEKLMKKGFASNNCVFGVGSFSYSLISRDTHGMAMKSTYAVINGEPKEIFKDPKTDTGLKKSAKGLLMVTQENGEYVLHQCVTIEQEKQGCLESVFLDGKLIRDISLADIRKVVNDNLSI